MLSEPRTPNPFAFLWVAGSERSEGPVLWGTLRSARRSGARSAAADEFAAAYHSECEPGGLYGALEEVALKTIACPAWRPGMLGPSAPSELSPGRHARQREPGLRLRARTPRESEALMEGLKSPRARQLRSSGALPSTYRLGATPSPASIAKRGHITPSWPAAPADRGRRPCSRR